MVTLRKGDTGAEVKKLQTALNRAGCNLTVDGSFGDLTHSAVKWFQAKNGLSVDGVAGPLTWDKLTETDFSALGMAVQECLEDIQKLPSFIKVMELM